jgi:hypothetical protein
MVLAQACVAVLSVSGAGVSLTDGQLRVPLGASDAAAAQAEALQTTLGEGPCLEATATSDPLIADEASMAARWPIFSSELLAATPFRSVASLPLRSSELLRFGALDLYSTDPDPLLGQSLDEVSSSIADPIAAILFDGPSTAGPSGAMVPSWTTHAGVTRRMQVWTAVGMLIAHAGLNNLDALAALRAYAYGHSASLDDVAEDITRKRLHPQALID